MTESFDEQYRRELELIYDEYETTLKNVGGDTPGYDQLRTEFKNITNALNDNLDIVENDYNNTRNTQYPNLSREYIEGTNRLGQVGMFYPSGDTTLETVYRSRGLSDPTVAYASNYWGLNHAKTGSYVTRPRIAQGLVFFTRPRIRLTYDNLINDRTFMMMNTTDQGSVASMVRAYLDPVGHRLPDPKNGSPNRYVNPDNPFISPLTNQLKNLSGWSEIVADSISSKSGLQGEVHSMADGHPKFYGSGSISATFKNFHNDFIGFLFHIWTQYMMMVHKGRMVAYPDDIVLNRINYNTRIYRFLTDITGQYILDWTACGAAFPLNSGKAGIYDYTDEERIVTSIDQHNISFQVNGMMHMDPYVLKAFNLLMLMYVPQLHSSTRKRYFVKLSLAEKPFFNYLALPFIDLKTAKLEWYVYKEQYYTEMKIFNRRLK